MSRTLRLTVPVEVEVDLDAWADTYGTLPDQDEPDVRSHVPALIANAVHDRFTQTDNGAELVGDLYDLTDEASSRSHHPAGRRGR